MPDKPDYYDFAGVRIFTTERHLEILATKKDIVPSQIHRAFLLALIKKFPDVITYEELWKEVWRSNTPLSPTDLRNIQTTKGALISWLKNNKIEKTLVESLPGKGYRLTAEVFPGWFEDDSAQSAVTYDEDDSQTQQDDEIEISDNAAESREEKTAGWLELFKPDAGYLISVSVFYGMLFLIASVMEISYRFEVYGKPAIFWGLLLMAFNGAAVFSAFLLIIYRLYQKKKAFLFSVSALIGAALASLLISARFLPFQTVTESELHTQPAFVAFAKNVLVYFLPLGIVFLLLPFYIVAGERMMRRGIIRNIPSDTILISPKSLLIICSGMIILSFLSTNYFLDKLNIDSPYHAIFVSASILRMAICFGLPVISVAWYYHRVSLKQTIS